MNLKSQMKQLPQSEVATAYIALMNTTEKDYMFECFSANQGK